MATSQNARTGPPQRKTAVVGIGVSRITDFPEFIIDEFVEAMRADEPAIEVRAHGSHFAGLEWLMPTAVVLYVTHVFFAAMISEAGKDAYKRLKTATLSLHHKAQRQGVSRIGSSGKLQASISYSPIFSILVPTRDELTFKFLIQPDLSEEEASEALDAFFYLIESYFAGSITPETLARLESTRCVGRTLLLAYDFSSHTIVGVDPMPAGPHH